jgi:hypothetical protein
MFDHIFGHVRAALAGRKDLRIDEIEGHTVNFTLSDGTPYYAQLDDADVEPEEEGGGTTLHKFLSRTMPLSIKSPSDVLDVCLNALAADARCMAAVSDLTTDGDGSDCEAIFKTPTDGHLVLKVR